MDKFPLMLYKQSPAGEPIHGLGRFATTIVSSEDELEAARAAGWSLTTSGALEATAKAAEDAPATADELRERLKELGAEVPHPATREELAALVLVAEKFGVRKPAVAPIVKAMADDLVAKREAAAAEQAKPAAPHHGKK